jgi:hypothetical protein
VLAVDVVRVRDVELGREKPLPIAVIDRACDERGGSSLIA